MHRPSPASTSLAFIVLLTINAILFSNSRLAAVSHPAGFAALTRRSVLASPACNPNSVPTDQRCEHARQSCPDFLSLQNYYCSPQPSRSFVFIGLLVWLTFLFSTLGISASDFFCPNLASISNFLGLDHNVAGVTFLAFGNGSPDVFSTFSAMKAGSGSLAIGELIGAASFIVSVVVGSIAFIRPFRVPRGPFLRDVGFFTVAVSLLIVIAHDGTIHSWEAAVLVVLYLIYVMVVVIGSFWERKRNRKRVRELIMQQEYTTDELPQTPYRDEEPAEQTPLLHGISVSTPNLHIDTQHASESLRLHHSMRDVDGSATHQRSLTQLPSFSLLGAIEFRQVISSLQKDSATSALASFDLPISPFAAGHYYPHFHFRSRSQHAPDPNSPHTLHAITQTRHENEIDPWDASLGLPLNERRDLSPGPGSPPTTPPALSKIQPPAIRLEAPSESYSPTPSEFLGTRSAAPQPRPLSRFQKIARRIRETFHVLFPTLHNFRSKTIIGKLVSLFAAPAVLALTLTLPVVISSAEGSESHPANRGAMDVDHPSLIDFEEEGVERTLTAEAMIEEDLHEAMFNKWLVAVQCALGPIFCAMVLFNGGRHFVIIMTVTAAVSSTIAVLVALFADRGNDPAGRLARCFMGFFVAVVWIMAIADEVVTVLQTFGFIFGFSDAIIGLTVFAVGNSLADLIADVSVASFAPIMAFSACIGGPMLNILLGVGGSGTYIIRQTGTSFSLQFSTTLMVSSIGLLSLLVATILFVPYNDYWLTKRWGVFLICCYCLIMVLNVIVEAKSL